MTNSRLVAVNIINQVISNSAYSNIALNAELSKLKIDDRDKAFITELVYGTLKYKYKIDKILKYFLKKSFDKTDPFLLNMLRISIYQINYLDRVPSFAVVDEAVEITKKKKSIGASKLINGVLRNYLRNLDTDFSKGMSYIDKLSFDYSFEPWMVKLFMDQYGKELCEKILKGLNEIPSTTVRVNNLKDSFENVYNKLIEYGYNIDYGEICPEAIKIIQGKSIEKNPLFSQGFITVQDESSMLVAACMELEPNMSVIDLCSAPGGKATHMAELMNNTGKIKAFDLYENKLRLINQNSTRLGINIIETNAMDAASLHSELVNTADRILIDAPCSGLGIIRKKPEIKWTKDKSDLDEIVKLQKEILSVGSKYIKTNGILIYSTCTLNKCENEENVEWFLKNHPNYKTESIYFGKNDNIVYNKEGMVTILPNEEMDGFFIAKFRRHE